MGILLGISIILFYLPKAKAQPDWFPKVSCEKAWQGQDPYQYSYEKFYEAKENNPGNFGYQNFIQDVESQINVKRKDCFKKWTVLVYMAADNDLSPYSLWDLTEMEADYPIERELGYLRAGSTLTNDLHVDLQNYERQDL
ncbi:MAG: hypothetical protein MJK18_04715, partial [Bdellovibrionales bacterium]|nr:hypothetical protein [Bdellovibrionales bacterium]